MVDEVQIYTDTPPDLSYEEIGPIKARVTSKTIISKSRTVDEVNAKLRKTAQEAGANAVIAVEYKRGISVSSWKGLTATGTAVLVK